MGFVLDARFIVGAVIGAFAYHLYLMRKAKG